MTDRENVCPFASGTETRRQKHAEARTGERSRMLLDPEYSQSGCEMREYNGGRGPGLYYTAKSESGLLAVSAFRGFGDLPRARRKRRAGANGRHSLALQERQQTRC